MMKLRINPIVAEDLKNIKEYIAEDNEEMAVKTIQEIYARFENIQQFPYMGADLAKRVSFRTDYKYVICGNYVVLYKIRDEYVEIYPIVAEDLKNIREYIAEDNEEMAVKTIQEIYDRIENIQQFPYMGADLAKRVSFRTDYKYVICGNYVVLYKIGEEYVEIYRVVNRYQDITKIFL